MYFNDDIGQRDAEITPWSLENHALGGDYLYLVTTYDTYMCSSPYNIFSLSQETRIDTSGSCKKRQSSTVTPENSSTNATTPLWSRDYYGAFSGQLVPVTGGIKIYTINHGELLNNNYFSSTSCVQAPNIGYGTFPCTAAYSDKSYNAFVGMSSFDWTLANYQSNNSFTDLGPIVWPANGYVDNGGKATDLGILHPTSIIKDSYLYVFFRDTSQNTVDGRTAGLKVARAPITGDGIDPHSFKTYFNGDFADSALPSGFDQSHIMNYFSQKGGRSSALFENDTSAGHPPDVYSFSVAKLTDTNLYLGVAQDLYVGITLRLSDDLVNWSQQTTVPGTAFDYFTDGGTPNFIKQPLMYPRLANANGDTDNEIDPNDFYIIGTTKAANPFNTSTTANIVDQLHLKLSLPTPSPTPKPTPTPTPKPGDLNGDGKVDIFDYNILVANFGHPYTIFDYNNLVANFGR